MYSGQTGMSLHRTAFGKLDLNPLRYTVCMFSNDYVYIASSMICIRYPKYNALYIILISSLPSIHACAILDHQ